MGGRNTAAAKNYIGNGLMEERESTNESVAPFKALKLQKFSRLCRKNTDSDKIVVFKKLLVI